MKPLCLSKAFANLKLRVHAWNSKKNLPEILAKGDLLRGTGGFRKVRMRLPGRGKSGGVRVIYYYLSADGVVYLVSLYAKKVQENLTAKQTKQLKELSTIIKAKIQEAKDHE